MEPRRLTLPELDLFRDDQEAAPKGRAWDLPAGEPLLGLARELVKACAVGQRPALR
jgi:hypothetical protein